MEIWLKKFFMNFVEIGLLNCRILLLYYIILICLWFIVIWKFGNVFLLKEKVFWLFVRGENKICWNYILYIDVDVMIFFYICIVVDIIGNIRNWVMWF